MMNIVIAKSYKTFTKSNTDFTRMEKISTDWFPGKRETGYSCNAAVEKVELKLTFMLITVKASIKKLWVTPFDSAQGEVENNFVDSLNRSNSCHPCTAFLNSGERNSAIDEKTNSTSGVANATNAR